MTNKKRLQNGDLSSCKKRKYNPKPILWSKFPISNVYSYLTLQEGIRMKQVNKIWKAKMDQFIFPSFALVVAKVFSFFSLSELMKMNLVCKMWKQLIETCPISWTNVIVSDKTNIPDKYKPFIQKLISFQESKNLSFYPMLKGLVYNQEKSESIHLSKYAPFLTTLCWCDKKLNNIYPFNSLVRLQTLILNGNFIVDISPLSKMIHLIRLELKKNQIWDLTPLQHLFKLSTLNVSGNPIQNLKPLSRLSSLTRLNIGCCQVSDISPLMLCKKLIELKMKNNQISDMSPLYPLPIKQMDISLNPVQDLFSPKGLKQVYWSDGTFPIRIVNMLALQMKQFDFVHLRSMNHLVYLDISRCESIVCSQFETLDGTIDIPSFPRLRHFSACHCKAFNLMWLKNAHLLNFLLLSETKQILNSQLLNQFNSLRVLKIDNNALDHPKILSLLKMSKPQLRIQS